MRELFQVIGFIVLGYFCVLNGVYLIFTVVAWFDVRRQRQRRMTGEGITGLRRSPLTPGISMLVPAYNEQATISESVRSLLALDYPKLEVIVVNDGSADRTVEQLIDYFDLVEAPIALSPRLPYKPVRGTYLSRKHPNIVVIDKQNGGKADALNAACAAASHPYVCAIDADAVLEDTALGELAERIIHRPDLVVAIGGIVRIANGCRVEGGRVVEVRMPHNLLAAMQVAEYLRAFLIGRIGWSRLKALVIISGAFGLFNRDVVEDVGGWSHGTVGEDVELVLRIHRRMLDLGRDYRVDFVSDPVCWTEAPEDWRTLSRQRRRWQRGMLESLSLHRKMLFNPRYRQLGLLALPYFLLFEVLGPLIELSGYLLIPLAVYLKLLSFDFLIGFSLLALALGVLISLASLTIEEFGYRRHSRRRDLIVLIVLAVIENVGYRQMQTLIRLAGTYDWMRKKQGWGEMRRRGFTPES